MFIVFLSLLAFFGLRGIISGAVFFNTSGSQDSPTSTKEDEEFYGYVKLNSLPVATNSASVQISGTVMEFNKIKVFLNNKEVSDKLLNSDTFETVIDGLEPGKNEVYVTAYNNKNISETSETSHINYINTPPPLEIESHKDGDTLNKANISLSGQTDAGSTLKLNNFPVVVSVNGKFNQPYTLQNGDNTLTFTVSDKAGNITTKVLTLKFSDSY